MATWDQIWKSGAPDLWSIPDRAVLELASRWKAGGTVRRVLDLGCGAGRHLLPLAADGFLVTGIDHAPSAIAECRSRLDHHGLKAELHCAEMTEIPYEDCAFDAVIAFNSIYHGPASQLRRIAELLHAKLRPGGEGFITLPSRENRMYGKGEPVGPHTFVNPGMFAGLFPNDGERGIPHYFASEADICSIFSGFHILSLTQHELHLASVKGPDHAVHWLRVPKAFFWNLEVIRK